MDIEKLLKALDNENNSKIFNMNTSQLADIKLEILQELELSHEEIKDYMKKLQLYKYVDEVDEIKQGRFIRWIPLTDPENVYLTAGGMVCDITITDTGISIICKNFAHKYYQIKLDECQIFQKLTGEEQVLLSALDHLTSK
jgi:hypothetical protein